MKNQFIALFAFMSIALLSSCGVSNCGCPMTYESVKEKPDIIEKEGKKTGQVSEKLTVEHTTF